MLSTIEPYKGRTVDMKRRVEVYRNLTKKGAMIWYSVRQGGLVIGHSRSIHLKNCYFTVNESGRQRVIDTGHKNVHAFVTGFIKKSPARHSLGLPLNGMYNPRTCSKFMVKDNGVWSPVVCAMEAELSAHGLFIWMPRA